MNDSNLNVNNNVDSNVSEKENHYRDYLPENRIKNEGFSPKVWGVLAIVLFVVGIGIFGYLKINNKDFLKVESRYYNLNKNETLDLDSIYKSDNEEVIWESNSDAVVINNNVVTAVKDGDAYILARVGNKQVSDVNITVLTGDNKVTIDNHSININSTEKAKVTVSGSTEDKVDNDEDFYEGDIDWGGDSSYETWYEDYAPDEVVSDSIVEPDYDIVTINNDNEKEIVNNDNLVFDSSDKKVATVDDEGNVIPKNPGVTIITVKDEEGNEDHTYVTIMKDDVKLANDNYTINVNDTIKVSYVLQGVNYKDEDIKWSSKDPSIISVDDKGNVTAKAEGEAVVELAVGNIIKKINFLVKKDLILPSDIKVDKESINLVIGKDDTINAEVFSYEADNKDVVYTSNDTTIATVDNNGKVIGKGEGNAIINATTINGLKKEIKVKVTRSVVNVSTISLQEKEMTIDLGGKKKLEYSINPINATDRSIKIEYDKNYVDVDEFGNIIAKKAGNTDVTVTTIDQNKSDTVKVIVPSPIITVSSVTMDLSSLTLNVGDSKLLKATVLPDDAVDKNVKWVSNNTKVATVDNNGNVKAIGVGNATISAIVGDIKANCEIKVGIPLNSIILNKASLELKQGDVQTLTVSYNPNNTTVSKNVIWTSSNTKVATVDDGLVTAVGAGTATITAKVGDKTATCNVTIPSPLVGISLNKGTLSIGVNRTEQLKVIYNPPNTTDNKKVAWSSSNTKIAVVDNNGNVKGVAKGSATITAKVGDKTATCKVTVSESAGKSDVIELKSISLNKSSLSLEKGKTNQLMVTYNPSNTTDERTVVWTSNDTKVATVDNNGNVKGIAKGSAIITAKVGNKTATCKVAVTETTTKPASIELKSITLNKTSLSLASGKKEALSVVYNPTDTTVDRTIKWSTSDSKVVTVSNGVVTAVGNGTATITAKVGDKTATCKVTVTGLVEKYTIKYDANGGTGTMSDTTCNANTDCKLADNKFSKNFYDFDGWYDAKNGGKKYGASVNLTGNITVYAHWKNYIVNGNYVIVPTSNQSFALDVEKLSVMNGANVQLYTRSNGATHVKAQTWKVRNLGDGLISIINVHSQKSLDIAGGKMEKENNIQIYGWNASDAQKWYPVKKNGGFILKSAKDKNFALDVKGANFEDNNNLQLYNSNESKAQIFTFIPVNYNKKYSIVYNANGGTGTMSSQNDINYDAKVVLNKNKYTRSGYRMIGWTINKDGSGVVYPDGAYVGGLSHTGGTVTLYAKWEEGKGEIYTPAINAGINSALSILIKSKDGKLALYDAGRNCSYIINQLYNYSQRNDLLIDGKVELEYFILSHTHGDHYSCAGSVIRSNKIKVKIVIMKQVVNDLVGLGSKIKELKKDYNFTLEYTNNYNEGKSLELGSSKIYLFNNKDAFKDYKSKCQKNGELIKSSTLYFEQYKGFHYRSLKNDGRDPEPYLINSKYVYLDSVNSKSFNYKNSFDNTSYFGYKVGATICNENVNSVTLLVEFPVNGGKKYAYLTGDVQNNGYSYFGEDYKGTKVYGIDSGGGTYFYNFNKTSITPNTSLLIKKPQEYISALEVYNKLNGKVSDIVIYQQSHHGNNVDPASLDKLKLKNRKDLYVIVPRGSVGYNKRLGYTRSLNNSKQSHLFYSSNCTNSDCSSLRNRDEKSSDVILTINNDGTVTPNRKQDNGLIGKG